MNSRTATSAPVGTVTTLFLPLACVTAIVGFLRTKRSRGIPESYGIRQTQESVFCPIRYAIVRNRTYTAPIRCRDGNGAPKSR
jgi:hypothetical protein